MKETLDKNDSYRRENPEEKDTEERMTAGGYRPDECTEDKKNINENTTDKNAVNERMAAMNGVGGMAADAGGEEDRAMDPDAVQKNSDLYAPAAHVRDANSRSIFRSRRLTCQFLRDYSGLSIFSDLQPEDIEDVTDHYRAFLGVEFEADTVKKVRIRVPDGEQEIFVLPLIEHKSNVDYDVAMQLLRYMTVIWYDYKKQQDGLRKGNSSRKGFRYPPIIPIVYYEGRAEWTADMRLSDRIDLSSGIKEYIPDFTYKVVRLHGYGNEELKKKHNEMSLVMMINRIQSPEDYTEFLRSSRGYVDEIYDGTPEEIREVYREILWSLFRKMNVPMEEAREKLAEMEESGMGYLFENANFDSMDIQEERRNTAEARAQLAEAKQKLEAAEQKAQTAERKAETAERKAETAEQKAETAERMREETGQALQKTSSTLAHVLEQLVAICRSEKLSREETIKCLQERYGLDADDAVSAAEQFWAKE